MSIIAKAERRKSCLKPQRKKPGQRRKSCSASSESAERSPIQKTTPSQTEAKTFRIPEPKIRPRMTSNKKSSKRQRIFSAAFYFSRATVRSPLPRFSHIIIIDLSEFTYFFVMRENPPRNPTDNIYKARMRHTVKGKEAEYDEYIHAVSV